MSISETLFAMAAAATILDFLLDVGRWIVGYKRERKVDKQVQRSQEKK